MECNCEPKQIIFHFTISKKKIFEDFNILESRKKLPHILSKKKKKILKERGKCEFYICMLSGDPVNDPRKPH